ncbi:MAG: hypothetical protein KatS3mg107_0571 [Gemmataceae bacterium]|nr:MAG: hypothetical protein KatS3mg107_0571 [Gemmataceae bacterium]
MSALTVIIPTHRGGALLYRCLQSVLRHAPSGTEILVVDDASPQEALQSIIRDFPTILLFRLPRRRGFCYAANIGIEAAHNPIVELLNDDTEVAAGWAEAALAHFQQSDVVAVAPLILQYPKRKGDSTITLRVHRCGR